MDTGHRPVPTCSTNRRKGPMRMRALSSGASRTPWSVRALAEAMLLAAVWMAFGAHSGA
jgi:hypothetical protein